MSSRIFQNVISKIRETVDRNVGILDDRGYVIASSDLSLIGSRLEEFGELDFTEAKVLYAGERCFRTLSAEGSRYDYIAYVDGTDELSGMICAMAAVAFNESKQGYDEKHNKAAFIKNIISDNILPGDVYVRAKELHFITDDPRCVILIRMLSNRDVSAVEIVQKLFPDRQNDFVLTVNENDIVVVKLLQSPDNLEDAFSVSEVIRRKLREELNINTVVGISTIADHLRELADKYKEAQVAIEVGSIFEADQSIIKYDSLGLGRIIYQLPTRLCEMFLNEVFKKNSIDSLDEDTLDTIDRFFENNLNVSETSRKLYVHRNTLVYRLEKIKKLTGLDLREFDHAIVFKVALMVKQYLDSLGKPRI